MILTLLWACGGRAPAPSVSTDAALASPAAPSQPCAVELWLRPTDPPVTLRAAPAADASAAGVLPTGAPWVGAVLRELEGGWARVDGVEVRIGADDAAGGPLPSGWVPAAALALETTWAGEVPPRLLTASSLDAEVRATLDATCGPPGMPCPPVVTQVHSCQSGWADVTVEGGARGWLHPAWQCANAVSTCNRAAPPELERFAR